jgi:hypothetical protein
LVALGVLVASAGVRAEPITGTIYFTTYNPINAAGVFDPTATGFNEHKVDYTYDGTGSFVLGPRVAVARTNGADGIIFHPDGSLLVGGQSTGLIHKVDPVTGTSTSVSTGFSEVYHLTLGPDGKTVYSGGIPASLISTTVVSPLTPGTAHAIVGEDGFVTQVSFDAAGNAYYTNASPSGAGAFGTIDVSGSSFVTDRKLVLPSAHGMAYDSFTNTMLTFGDQFISQINLTTLTATTIAVAGQDFDQGTVDGKGHLFVASNNGNFFFMDYSGTGSIATAGNYQASSFLANYLDDVAPLSGAGSAPPVVPLPSAAWGGIALLAGLGLVQLRRKDGSQLVAA